MRQYDLLFVTHLPAFYKVNLYNEISKKARVFVIFVGRGSTIRSKDFTEGELHFDYCFLNEGDFEKRNPYKSLINLYLQLKKIQADKIVVGGWDLAEYWFLALTHKKKAMLTLESSLFESHTKGVAGRLKQFFLQHIKVVFASGEPHLALLKAFHFKGETKKTGGVGIFRYAKKEHMQERFAGRFLYVGRLSPEKNLSILIDAFKDLPQYSLSIVGEGEQKNALKNRASANIQFLGYIPNDRLPQIYQEHNVFVLPSLKEPWGLVVEEALYYGLPVLVSNKVGCAKDLVENLQTGLLFEPGDKEALKVAIAQMAEKFEDYAEHTAKLDFSLRDKKQVQQYLEVTK